MPSRWYCFAPYACPHNVSNALANPTCIHPSTASVRNPKPFTKVDGMQFGTRWLTVSSRGRSHFPHNARSSYEWMSTSMSKRRFSCSFTRSYRSSTKNADSWGAKNGYQILRMQSNHFWTYVFLVSFVREATPNHISLKCRCPNKNVTEQLSVVYVNT